MRRLSVIAALLLCAGVAGAVQVIRMIPLYGGAPAAEPDYSVLVWKFDNTNEPVFDYSPIGTSTGVLGAAATRPTYATNCYYYDGGDFIYSPDRDVYSFGDGFTDRPFLMCGWVFPVAGGTYGSVFAKQNNSSTLVEYWAFWGYLNEAMTLRLNSRNSSTYMQTQSFSGTVQTNRWQFLVFTYNGNGPVSNNITLWSNATNVSAVFSTNGYYVAMTNTSQQLEHGRNHAVAGTKGYFGRSEIWTNIPANLAQWITNKYNAERPTYSTAP